MRKALVVVDYQVDFVSGALGFAGAELLETPIAEKIIKYHLENCDVYFTFDTQDRKSVV